MRYSINEVLEFAGKFFMGNSPIQLALRRITRALTEMKIPYALAGALAVNAHGHRRTTEDVDLLMTREGLQRFKERWLGLGWVEKFPGSKGLRDTEHNVKIDVILTGEYPGDGKPKPIAFPDPAQGSAPNEEGIAILTLPVLLELKIASGMTAPHRPRDLDDTIQLIRNNRLPRDYAESLHPFVRAKFEELWQAAQVEEDY